MPIRGDRLPGPIRKQRHVSFWLESYDNLGYVVDWREAFRNSPRLAVDEVNISDLIDFPRALRRIGQYDLVIVLHSAAGDNMAPLRRVERALRERRAPLVLMVGNEYDRMADKIAFARAVEADIIATQLPIESGRWLYAQCEKSRVVAAPAALNPTRYRSDQANRAIDIGFRGGLYQHQFALGDTDRTDLLMMFQRNAESWGLTVDIVFERQPLHEWSAFLNRCVGTVGAESGTRFLERDDTTRDAVIAFLEEHPAATFADVYERFFREHPLPVSGKAVSSRHFEPIGTRTVQILLEGAYNGILEPGTHYIQLRRDHGNIDEALDGFRDPHVRAAITDAALAHVLEGHTYAHRVGQLLDAAEKVPVRPVG